MDRDPLSKTVICRYPFAYTLSSVEFLFLVSSFFRCAVICFSSIICCICIPHFFFRIPFFRFSVPIFSSSCFFSIVLLISSTSSPFLIFEFLLLSVIVTTCTFLKYFIFVACILHFQILFDRYPFFAALYIFIYVIIYIWKFIFHYLYRFIKRPTFESKKTFLQLKKYVSRGSKFCSKHFRPQTFLASASVTRKNQKH